MESVMCKGSEMIQCFIRQTRELNECPICNHLLHDPVETRCGHMFCRSCITKLVARKTSHTCPRCQVQISKSDLQELQEKNNKIVSPLLKFVEDFCNEGGWNIDTLYCANGGKNNSVGTASSKTLPLQPKEILQAAEAIENEGNTVSPLFPSSSSSSNYAPTSTLEPQYKVQQWLMTSTNEAHENCENTLTTKGSETLSIRSSNKRLSSPLTISSSAKDSYDITSAPSPPPSREELKQSKRGRGGRRGRPRKNALPINSGEVKKRERSAGSTPDSKVPLIRTPSGQPTTSPEVACNVSSTPNATMTSTPASSATARSNGSKRNETTPMLEDKEMFSVDSNTTVSNKEIPEILTNTTVRRSVISDTSMSSPRSVSTRRSAAKLSESRTPIQSLEKRPSLQPISFNAFSPIIPPPEKEVVPISAIHHLTPVSRPKARTSLDVPLSVRNTLQTSAPDNRRHSTATNGSSPVPETRRPTVNFFHKGRIVPKRPISIPRKQPIVFTCLGKLGPPPSKNNSIAVAEGTVCNSSFGESLASEARKSVETKETQTLTATVTCGTQTEPTEIASVSTNRVEKLDEVLIDTQTQLALFNEVVDLENESHSPVKQHSTKRVVENGLLNPDECSEDAFIFAEPFKRTRALSSDSEHEKTESKRRKSSPPPNRSLSLNAPSEIAGSSVIGNAVEQSSVAEPTTPGKTVVMESDQESDSVDLLAATPPPPPPPKPMAPLRKVLTCSGLPRSQVKVVEDWARRIGAEVTATYTPTVTHVIVQLDEENCAQRTLKFLYGVANGKWIVGIDWVHQCIRENRLIDEEPFEALDMDGEDGPRRGRQKSQTNKLFHAFEFCCQEPFTDVTVAQLRELLELCGAATVSDPSNLTKSRRHAMIIVQTDDRIGLEVQRKAVSWFDRLQILSVSREWVLDCLASYQLLPIRTQLIGKHSESLLKMMGFDAQLLA